MKGRVLIAAGSDPGGGAGIQADIKTVTALGGYAAAAITALTAQDTRDVAAIVPVAPDFVRQQMALVLDDIGADAVKTGMLHDAAVVEAVADVLAAHAPGVPLVVDPVLAAKRGVALLEDAALGALKRMLLPRAALVTPNVPEAEALSGLVVHEVEGMRRAGEHLLALGAGAALVKGGHIAGDVVRDVLVTRAGWRVLEAPRIATRHTHGTGCTLASAIATGLAQGMALLPAIERARAYLLEAIRTAPGFGKGAGPLNHGHTVRST
jgi:hydroxymethylpyrimidine/phosphomethylpyrimidine kinase